MERRGLEPALTFASDGTLFVCAIRGGVSGSNVWRSQDEGKTFEHLGTGLPILSPNVRSVTGDLGGGDCDVTTDASDRVYLVDLWAGSSSVASTTDKGETWRGVPVSQISPGMDRPWIVGGEPSEVFVSGQDFVILGEEGPARSAPSAGGIWVARSTDGGLTFPQQVLAIENEGTVGPNGNLALGAGNLYIAFSKVTAEKTLVVQVAISADRGLTWTQRPVAELPFEAGCGSSPFVFPIVAADSTGGVYLTWALENPATKRMDVFFAASPDAGEHWNAPIVLTDRPGTRAIPWVAVGSSGRVGVAWFETNSTMTLEPSQDVPGSLGLVCDWTPNDPNAAWFLRAAFADDAKRASPVFEETLVQENPIHVGSLSRPYTEVLQIKFDPKGRAAVVYVADAEDGNPRPTFALQRT